MSELWRAVPGHPTYEVSDQGRLRRLPNVQRRAHPKTGVVQDFHYGHRMLTPIRTQYGYEQVNIGRRIVFLHRVVLEAFVGPRPAGCEACHGNGVRHDNRASNLRWDTKKANQADIARHGTKPRGEKHRTAKYSAAVVEAIKAGGIGPLAAREAYGISGTQFYRIRNGESRKHG